MYAWVANSLLTATHPQSCSQIHYHVAQKNIILHKTHMVRHCLHSHITVIFGTLVIASVIQTTNALCMNTVLHGWV